MSRAGLTARVVIASLGVSLLGAGAIAQSTQSQGRDLRREPTGTAAIGGVVQDAATQRPLRRATVRLSGDQLLTGRQTITRDDGSFVFDGLAPGQYNVNVYRASYMAADHGAVRPGGTGSAIVLTAGQRRMDLVFRLLRYGSITGVIYDQDGSPAPGISVEALRYTMRTGRRTLSSVYGQPSFTDDRGVYRLGGLLPGQYYIAAGPSPDRGPSDVQRLTVADVDRMLQRLGGAATTAPFAFTEPRESYTPVYFPGSTDFAGAQRIVIALGEERAGVDIRLQLVPTARISGRITRLDGQPATGTQVVATAITEASSMDLFSPGAAGTTGVDAQGRFAFPALASGRYIITARHASPAGAAPATAPLWAMTEVAMSGTDQSIELVLQPGMTVSGKVVFDGNTLQPPASAAGVRVSMPNTSAGVTIGVQTATVNADGRFLLSGAPPGQYKLTASAPASPAGWALRSAMLNGVDVLDMPFAVTAGQNIDNVVLTYTDRPVELSGSLQTSGGTPTADYFIIVFSADRTFWAPSGRRQTMARPSSTGRYTVRNLPPGEYFVAAVTDVEQGDWFDPDFLERLIPAAAKLTLAEGERRTLDLKIAGS